MSNLNKDQFPDDEPVSPKFTVVHRSETGAVVALSAHGFHALAPTGEEIGMWHGKFQARAAADSYRAPASEGPPPGQYKPGKAAAGLPPEPRPMMDRVLMPDDEGPYERDTDLEFDRKRERDY